MTRRRFPETALQKRLVDFGNCCAECGIKVGGAAGLEWDHRVPLKMGGDDDLENLQPLCRLCHRGKTSGDAGRIAKAKRLARRTLGIGKQPKHPLPGSRSSGWRKRMDGTVERRR